VGGEISESNIEEWSLTAHALDIRLTNTKAISQRELSRSWGAKTNKGGNLQVAKSGGDRGADPSLSRKWRVELRR